MRARSIRLLALTAGFVVLLSGVGAARADFSQNVVAAGSAEAKARGTTAGIAMLDRATGTYTDNGANAHLAFGSASLVKLFIAERALRRARLGQITLSSADRTALGRMLRSSDDAAANMFWSRLGANTVVTDVAARYGLTETKPPVNPRYWGLTRVTAHDLVEFYNKMLSGAGGLHAADRDFIVGQLRRATTTGTDGVYQLFGLHDGLPGESTIGFKQGWMCCFSDGYIWRHSAGVVGQDSRYVVVVLSRDAASQGSAHTVASTTRAVQRMFPSGRIPRVQGEIGDLWYWMGGHKSRLGLPTGNQLPLAGGAMSHFRDGVIYWSPATGAKWMSGPILEAWRAQGKHSGPLGYPSSNPIALAGGTAGHFEDGTMYWSPGTGAHWMSGPILEAWRAQGKHSGPLGYPSSNPIALAGGTAGHFEDGTMYWSPGTGAHWMNGPILEAWRAQGKHNGPLGYPTSDPYRVPGGGTRVDFQHGNLTTTSGGQVVQEEAFPAGTTPGGGTTAPDAPGGPADGSGTTEDPPSGSAAATDVPVPSGTGADGTP